MRGVIRAFGSRVGTALLVTACVPLPSAPPAKAFHAPPPLRQVTLRQPPFRGYRLAASYVEKSSFRDGAPLRTGVIVAGLRVRTDASGLSMADTVADPPLLGGAQMADHVGGGLLFWSSSSLYTADTFLGALRPLLNIGYKPLTASFGPTFVLLRGAEGQRFAIDLRTRGRVALSPPLLVDIASTDDGRALALLEGGSCALSTDAGKSYQPLNLPASEHALGVSCAGDALLVQLSSGSLLRLEKDGAASLAPAPAAPQHRPRADALWPLAEPPIERALRYGVALGEEFAGVAVAGAVATVNLRTGELVQVTRALVPSDLECRALDASGGLILACGSHERGTVVLSDVFGARPVTQARFPPGVSLAFADGVLLAASRCDGQRSPGAVCVRGADGRFRDHDVSAKLTAIGKATLPAAPGAPAAPPAFVSRFIPKQGGGALAVVTFPVSGLLDVQSGTFLPLAPEVPRAALDAPGGHESWLGLDWVAFKDGSVRGWLSSTGVAIARDGRLEPSVYEFRTVVAAGPHALAFDKGRHAFQSSDWGQTWVETLAPPGSVLGNVPMLGPRCSPVGCHLGPWLRVGWEPDVPGALLRTQLTAAPLAVAREPLTNLICKQRGAAVVSELSAADADSDELVQALNFGAAAPAPVARPGTSRGFFAWTTVHPLNGAGPALGLRAGLVAEVPSPLPEREPPPKNWSGYAQGKAFTFVSAFEPRAPLRTASVSWRALFSVAEANGVSAPTLQADEGAALSSLPVLGREAGQADGLLLDDGAPVWVHDAGGAEPYVTGAETDELTVLSAVASAPHVLALLVAGTNGSVEVREVRAGKARRLFQLPSLDPALYPANADALAIGPHGTLAVLRTRSGVEPATNEDPPVLLDEHGTLTKLAPWSRLLLADTRECNARPDDYRVILQTSRAWLKIVDSGVPVSDGEIDAGMFAMLRLNPDRICLEAVELAEPAVQRQGTEYPTRLAARFVGPSKGAARLGFAPGFELRQPLDCALSASR